MKKRQKRVIARIMAVLMAFTLLPFDTWGAVNVVMAEENEVLEDTGGGFSSEAETLPVEETTGGDETPTDEDKQADSISAPTDEDKQADSISAPTDEDKQAEDEKDADVKEEKPAKETDLEETEKTSAEVDNKADDGVHVHNFTTDGTSDSSGYYTISGQMKSGPTAITYGELSLTAAMKLGTDTVTFTAESEGTLTLVIASDDGTRNRRVKVDTKNDYRSENGVIVIENLAAGEHTIGKGGDTANIYYISFVEKGAAKEKAQSPTPTPETTTELKVGDKITLASTTSGATIYYTTDGTDPKESASKQTYATPISVTVAMVTNGEVTIKAYASKPDDYTDSDTAEFTYNVSEETGANQCQKPTAEPAEREVPKGTPVLLKSTDGADIYYTTDGTAPSKTNGTHFAESTPIVIDKETTIKAVAVKDSKENSFIASFTYTIKKPNKPTVDADSVSIISDVKLGDDVRFVAENGDEVFDVKLKAVVNTAPTSAITTKAESLKKDGGTILYYDLTLVNAKAPNDKVTIASDSTGKLNVTMKYSIANNVNSTNDIIVLHNTDQLTVTNESDGFSFDANDFSPYTVIINPAEVVDSFITKRGGYEEGAFAEWTPVKGANGYMAYVAKADGNFERIDDELIRQYADHWRVDAVGLAKGTYYIKVNAVMFDENKNTATVLATETTKALKVTNYDRSGFAFSSNSQEKTASGAYKDDGTLRDGAQVIYVTAKTAKTCKATVNGAEVTGLQSILDAKQKKTASNDILDIRIVGCVSLTDLDHISSSKEGLQVKGANGYQAMNVTIEGIGEDASVKGFGFLVRNCGNVELRNFGILNYMDDGVSMDTGNCNIWVHDLDIFYGSTGGDKDQAKGDGTIDIKAGSTYVTIAYNHFWDSGKSSLCGMEKPDADEFMVTYHHNWFDHSDSRHARVRRGTVHLYNNYYDGNAKYGVGATNGSSIFVEANYFRNCKDPMLISTQGSEAGAVLSGENGGIIKAYNNVIIGAKNLVYQNSDSGTSSANSTSFDAYLVTNRADKVPDTVKTLTGGTTYNNFDTSSSYDLGVTVNKIDAPEDVPEIVMAKAGRLNGGDFKWTFDNATEDTNYSVIKALKEAVVNYELTIEKISGGVTGEPTVLQDNSSSKAPSGNEQTIEVPTASVPYGEVEKGTKVTLSCATSGADIYYTINGKKPTTTEGKKYEGEEIEITANTTIRAIAVVGSDESDVGVFIYTIPGGSTVTPTPGPGGPTTETKTYEFNPESIGFSLTDTETDSKGTVKQIHKMPTADTKYGTDEYFTIGNNEAGNGKIGKTSTSGGTTKAPTPSKSSVTEYSVRYQFGGTTANKDDPRAIRFTVSDKATANVYVGAYRINTNERNLYLDTNDNVKTLSQTVTEYKFENVEAGAHGIYAKDGDIAILYVIVEEIVTTSGGDTTIVTPPTANPSSGSVKKGDTIALTATGDIYYIMTTDGSDPADPTTDSDKCTAPIAITAEAGATVKIKAIAVVDGKSSAVASFTYTVIKVALSDLEASPVPEASKKYPVGVDISLISKEGGTIYYTLDETDPQSTDGTPTSTSTPLTQNGTISLDTEGTHTIKAFAVKDGYLPSKTATFVYTVSQDSDVKQLGQPTITPASKEVKAGDKITVTITKAESDPADTKIYYTIDGTVPTEGATLYSEAFELKIDKTVTINAIAIKKDALSGPVASVTYTVKTTSGKKDEGIYISGLAETYTFTGAKIIPDIDVWYVDKEGDETLLALSIDYTVSYKNNVKLTSETGKDAEVIVNGKGNYKGKAELIKKFQIVDDALLPTGVTEAANLKGANLDIADKAVTYTGAAHYPNFTLTLKADNGQGKTYAWDETDNRYEANGEPIPAKVAVSNNVNKGTATILLTGAVDGKKATTVKKTFKILPVDLSKSEVSVSASATASEPVKATYAVKGAVPKKIYVSVKYTPEGATAQLTKQLVYGKDYTVKYSSNKQAGGTGKIVITGKGNYAKAYKDVTFAIEALTLTGSKVKALDVYDGMKVSKIKEKAAMVVDGDGNPLKPSQYKIEVHAFPVDEDGKPTTTELNETDTLAEKDVVKVTATAVDTTNLAGTTTEETFTVGISIAKAKVVQKADEKSVTREYNGREIILKGDDLKVTLKVQKETEPRTLNETSDYVIVSYANNINKGTATAVIKGVGAYSGTKTIKFKIVQKPMQIETKPWEDFFKKLVNGLTS